LKKLATDEPEKYVSFWGEFGRFFKEGVATDFTAKEDVLPLFRYVSSKSDGKLTSLDEYIGRMPESQTEIYYVLGDSIKSVANSPHLDPFKARDLEVLYWVDPIDPFVSPMLAEYKEKKLRNVDDAGIELPELAEETAEEQAEFKLAEADFNRVIGRFVTTLGSRITEVRASKVLKNSPIRLISPEDETNRDMQRIQRILDQNYEVPKKIVEVNRNHPLIANLAHLVSDTPDNPLINLTIEQLYDSALVQVGLHPNPTEMVPRIQQLLELATAS
jgi:molecular chaperone HtpG